MHAVRGSLKRHKVSEYPVTALHVESGDRANQVIGPSLA
jgi:hypothetical protein